jgi:ribosome-binding factor A
MSQRVAKVQKVAKEILGEAIQDLKDPRIGFATVTAVRVSADLRHARVYVSVMGSEEEKVETLRGLESARSILRGELGRQIRMKYLPELTFELDTGPEEAQRLETLLRQIHRSDDEDEG